MVSLGYDLDVQPDPAVHVAWAMEVAAPAAAVAPAQRRLLHITHARQDEAWVQGVLIPALGLAEGQYWTRAEDDVGALVLEELEHAVVSCRYTLLVASSAARADQWTQFAGLLAEHLGIEEGKPRLLVVTRDFAPESERGRELLPLRQRCLMCLDCSDPERSAAALATLVAQLALAGTDEAPAGCPYPGLRMFGAGDPGSCFDRPDLFFGRDEEGLALVDKLRTTGRALLVGPSGCGKSSLVRARVLPALGKSADAMVVAVVRPHTDADAALRAGLESLDPRLAAATDEYLAAADQPGALSALVEAAAGPGRLVYVDQLEEVFRDDGDEHASRAAFFARLAALARVPGVALLLGMRADFYGDLMRSPAWDDFKDHRVELTPLRGDALREAIVCPAERVGVHVEVDLVERLVREAEQDRAAEALPLLQVALEQLWAQREWRYLSLASYARLADGDRQGLDAVLARHADDSIDTLAEPLQVLARRVLIDLVHLGEGRPDTRRRRSSSELRRAGDDAGALGRVLAHLSARRLIAVGAEVAEAAPLAPAEGASELVERHVDLAHDTLITGWPALAGWVAERRNDLRTQRRLEARAAGGGLLAASELPELTRWVAWLDTPAGQALGGTEALRALVRRSVARRRFRRGAFGVGLTGAVTFAIVFGLQTVKLRDEQTKTQRSISKAAETAQLVAVDVERGLRTLAGASGVREKVLKHARDLLTELRKLGNLAEDDQRTLMQSKIVEGDLALERGRLEEARALYHEALADAQRRAAADPDNPTWQSDVSVSYGKLGGVAVSAGQLDVARAWFEQALVIIKTVAAKDSNNADWQRILSVVYNELGDVAARAGQLDAARASFEQALAVIKTVAAKDSNNADWQRDLVRSYENLGDVAVMTGQLDAARARFEQMLAGIKLLVAKDPNNADWQRDLSVSHERLGDTAVMAGQLDAAGTWFEQALAVRKTLAARDPDNAEWQRDVSVSYNKLGDVAVKASQLEAAGDWFKQALTISKTLTVKDPTNAVWRRDLAICYARLGHVALEVNQLDTARGWFEQTLAVNQALAAKDPSNTVWQHGLLVSYDRLGQVAAKVDQLDAARGWFEQALAVSQALAAKDSSNADWQRNVEIAFVRLGEVTVKAGQLDNAPAWYEQALTIAEELAAKPGSSAQAQYDLMDSHMKLASALLTRPKRAAPHLERAAAIHKHLSDAGAFKGDPEFARIGERLRELRGK